MSIIESESIKAVPMSQRVADGDYGAWQTLQAMKQMLQDYPCKEMMKNVVARITGNCKTDRCKIDSIYTWVMSVMRYQHDPPGVEQIKSPCRIMKEAAQNGGMTVGDCDDFTIILCAGYIQAGLPCAMLAVSSQKQRPDVQVQLDHVTAVVLDRQNKQWISTDPVAGAKTWEGHRAMLEKL